jgi:hypothetical protein
MFLTVEECDALYGVPSANSDPASDVRFYKRDGLSLKILFVEKKAAVVTYSSTTSLTMEKPAQQRILDENAGGNGWEEIEGEGAKTWRRGDGLAFAIYDTSNGELNIFSTDYIEKSKEEVETAINKQ